MNNLKFALRQLAKNPGFTAVAVATLALGIGANTAIFSFVNAVLLKPLPFKDPARLMVVFENNTDRNWHKNAVAPPALVEWRKLNGSFEGLGARGYDDFILTGRGQPETISGSPISANIFSLLGLKPMLGRDFLPEEETFGKHHVVLLSQELWQSRFGGDPNLIGRNITLNGEPHQVIGVMPPRTFFPDDKPRLWVPLAFDADRLAQRHNHSLTAYGRLKPGVTVAQAQADMNGVANRMAEANAENKGWGVEVFSLQEIMVGDSRSILLVLLGAVGLVLLIACANIANLLLARASGRSREFAIRAALGAGQGQIVRQLLIESVTLAVAGGAAGLLLGQMALHLLVKFSPPDLPRLWEGIHLDALTLAFALGVTVFTGLVFGLAPAWQTAKTALTAELNDSSRGSSGGFHGRRMRAVLVVSEMALSLILLVGAGLLIRSFDRLLSQPLGFVPEHVITVAFGLPDKTYSNPGAKPIFFNQLLERVRAVPGVDSAALGYGIPLGGQMSSISVDIPGAQPPAPGEDVAAGYSQISPGYFHALNTPVLRGRDFTDEDRFNTPPVVMVNEAFVRNFKLGNDVLGRRIRVGDGTTNAEIVGVVRDIKRFDIADAPRSEMYRPYRQRCWGYMSLIIRTQRDPAELMRVLRSEVDTLDKDLPFESPRTLTRLVASSVAQRRLSVQLLGGFAGVALALAAVGLYGVLAYNVAQRKREIGIRLALGARHADVMRLVLHQGMTLAIAGVAIGLLGAVGLARFLGSLLFEIKPSDPATFVTVTTVLVTTAFLACWLPARRAARVDPMVALRNE